MELCGPSHPTGLNQLHSGTKTMLLLRQPIRCINPYYTSKASVTCCTTSGSGWSLVRYSFKRWVLRARLMIWRKGLQMQQKAISWAPSDCLLCRQCLWCSLHRTHHSWSNRWAHDAVCQMWCKTCRNDKGVSTCKPGRGHAKNRGQDDLPNFSSRTITIRRNHCYSCPTEADTTSKMKLMVR